MNKPSLCGLGNFAIQMRKPSINLYPFACFLPPPPPPAAPLFSLMRQLHANDKYHQLQCELHGRINRKRSCSRNDKLFKESINLASLLISKERERSEYEEIISTAIGFRLMRPLCATVFAYDPNANTRIMDTMQIRDRPIGKHTRSAYIACNGKDKRLSDRSASDMRISKVDNKI
ncbi:hypothetical protein PUN28_007361 [Cardiocondyla obscurior]|uniref:Uncharacterized protein n=1 Tax=Cardiocondyla obscurior TaxID=286306 RepID=A0AAW2G354_9HYME